MNKVDKILNGLEDDLTDYESMAFAMFCCMVGISLTILYFFDAYYNTVYVIGYLFLGLGAFITTYYTFSKIWFYKKQIVKIILSSVLVIVILQGYYFISHDITLLYSLLQFIKISMDIKKMTPNQYRGHFLAA